jgi:hypothetical protein
VRSSFILLLLPSLALLTPGCAYSPDPHVDPTTQAVDSGVPNLLNYPGEYKPFGYQGGQVLTNPVNAYLVWYGSWTPGNNTEQTVDYFVNNISSSSYYGIDTSYYEIDDAGTKIGVASKVSLAKNLYVPGYPNGKSISNQDLVPIIHSAVAGSNLLLDPDGVYLLITDQYTTETSGQCDTFCGFHSYWNETDGSRTKYAFIGDPLLCPNSCLPSFAQLPNTSPNGSWEADGIVNLIAHELSEAETDPFMGAWLGSGTAEEIGDKCAWNFGKTYLTANLGVANVNVSGRDFIVQELWYNDAVDGGACVLGTGVVEDAGVGEGSQ